MGTLSRLPILALAVLLVVSDSEAWITGRESRTFDIAKQVGVVIDGDLSDWGANPFQVGLISSADGAVSSPDDYDVQARIGWDSGGLVLGFQIRDDVAHETRGDGVSRFDSISLRVADGLSSDRFLIVAVSPGADPVNGETRVETEIRSTVFADVEAAGRGHDDVFQLEIRVPMAVFGGVADGRTFALQIRAHDRDPGRDSFAAVWFPWDDLSVGAMSHVVRLSAETQSVPGVAFGSYPDLLRTQVNVICDQGLAGRAVQFKDGDRVLATGKLDLVDGRSQATLTADMPMLGDPYRDPVLAVKDAGTIEITIPNADERRAWRFTWQAIRFRDYAFNTRSFPTARLDEPMFARHLIGPYTVQTDYYDRNYSPVAEADTDGRYGAVVTIRTEKGQTYRRFRTLYKYSGDIRWWERDIDAAIDLPEEFGIDSEVLYGKRSVVSDHLKLMFWASLSRDQRIGAFLAGLRESVPGEGDAGFYDEIWERDRQWWVGLKRILYGQGPVEPIQAPVGVFKGRALELELGAEDEAGFVAGAAEAMDRICRAWWEQSGEPFSICVARKGKIVHLKSYGHREETPVTLTTKAPISSITKLLTGVQMAIVIDQKRVDPDATVSAYLPALPRDTPESLTVRNLMNHTSGFEGHWGDEDNDFEEQVAGYVSQAAVGRTYQYGGTAYAIAGKVIEAVSGETLPAFLKRHVLEPLGCEDTDVSGTSQDGQSTALDLARIGQLLLNGGAYGDFRFFEYEAFQDLLPRPLASAIPGTYRQHGLGTRLFEGEGLGEGAYGYGASSTTLFRVDPENDLVIAVARWRGGADYGKYKQELFDTIISHIASIEQPE
jgi:CubicO group peptidase (beta-lactamase class C family)